MSTAAFDRKELTVGAPSRIRERRRAESPVRKIAGAVGNGLLVVAIILCLPLAILAIGIPIALMVRLLLWIIQLL